MAFMNTQPISNIRPPRGAKLYAGNGPERISVPLLFLAIAVATAFTALPIDIFKDRENYFYYASDALAILQDHFGQSLLVGMTNEPLWLLLNSLLGYFFSPENVVRIIIFVPAFITMHFVFKAKPKYWLLMLFFLLDTHSLTNHIHHLRFALAVSVMLIALQVSEQKIRYAILALTPFIHAGFFVIAPIYFSSQMLVRYKKNVPMLVFLVFSTLIFVVLVFYVVDTGELRPRQVDRYIQFDARVGGGLFVMWSCVLVLFISQGYAFCEKHLFPIMIIVLYLCLYFVMPGVKRFLEGVIWLIIVAALSLSAYRRWAFIGGYSAYTALELYLKWDQPWLGLTYD